MADDPELIKRDQTAFRLDLTPAQLKVTHTALKSLLDDFGHEQSDVHQVIKEVLAKLPDEPSIRAIDLDTSLPDVPL
jgi:CRISPR/Cas system-associated endonuclease/helicase Cas3